jgi:iron complex outermembrane recepter protein
VINRKRVVAAAVLSALLGVDTALADESYDFNLPAQSLAESLRQIARRATMNILFDAASVEKVKAPAIRGTMPAEQALERALAGTQFVVEEVGRDSILISTKHEPALKATNWDGGGSVRLAAADVETTPAPTATAEGLGLQEVTVTAQRREENLQSVPIAINTVSGDDLQARGSIDIKSVSASVPNVTANGSTNLSIYIRGIGNTSASPNESSAATYVDGVYYASLQGLESLAFNNVERIEVLKGPQGTLFGRNSTAGVIQVVTPDPKHDFTGKVSLGYGNYESTTGAVYLTGGLSDTLAADISAIYDDQGKGWVKNLTSGQDVNFHTNSSVRSKWLWTPAEATRITASVDYSRFLSDGGNHYMVPGSVNSLDHVTTFYGKFKTVGDDTQDDQKQYGSMLRVDQDLGSLHGVSISSFRHIDGTVQFDGDQTPQRVLPQEITHDSDFWTQEFQLSNRDPGKFTWLVGAFYYGNDVDNLRVFTGSGQAAVGGRRDVAGDQKISSVSLFGQTTFAVADATNLTLGLRKTDETIKYHGMGSNALGQIMGPVSSKTDADPWTWRVSLDHQFTPDLLGYVSYNRGFKSGGYNLSGVGDPPFNPETLDAYEVGMKSESLDHRVRLNVAVFYYDFTNIQVVTVPGSGIQVFTNAAAARNFGLDASLDFAATSNLTLSAGLGALNAEFTDYPNARTNSITGAVVILPNAKGNQLANAPPFTGFLSATYHKPTSIGQFVLNGTASYSDRAFVTPDDALSKAAYTLVNGSVEWWSNADKPLGVRLWGRNLLNEYYSIDMLASGRGWYAMPAPPRMYGLTVMKNF